MSLLVFGAPGAAQGGGPWPLAAEEVTEEEKQERKTKLPKTIKLPAQGEARIDEGIYGE